MFHEIKEDNLKNYDIYHFLPIPIDGTFVCFQDISSFFDLVLKLTFKTQSKCTIGGIG